MRSFRPPRLRFFRFLGKGGGGPLARGVGLVLGEKVGLNEYLILTLADLEYELDSEDICDDVSNKDAV